MPVASAPTGRFGRRPTRGVMLGFSAWRFGALGAGAAALLIGLLAGSVLLGLLVLARSPRSRSCGLAASTRSSGRR